MNADISFSFAQNMGILRRERGISQRTAANALGISQALLSHYENGTREPGLQFLCRACKYYSVSADYMLGLSDDPSGISQSSRALKELSSELTELAQRTQNILKELDV